MQPLFKGLAAVGVALLMPLVVKADEQAASRLTQLLEPLETYSADFEQQILDSGGARLQSASGTMWLSRPGKFRWEVDEPYEQVVVSDGDQVYLYDPDLAQVTVQPLDTRVTHTPALLLSGSADALAESYEVTRRQQGTRETFRLTPKSPDTLFEQLQLVFDSEQLAGLRMDDSTGQQTAIGFDAIEHNRQIDPAKFEFEIPDDVDVIRESR
ncbi:outer membrane lipoprotein carrier protein [Modicisalibacter ilicicola DSM 19980]|uniref:Outer-membrane lipoprotein carrier protein n=1 Tax=Modicisalibacter ilicicola DSM 19980 TaxID=1121942 RepID=A0A1M4YAE1_9GAMM|nr:outer membrane lipoprotein chaperone LolA [Halomonas ilicicola]SHF02690.1 outer membrane lipoprotein carrier protein [Halomonas ilicicola DSM 19980]